MVQSPKVENQQKQVLVQSAVQPTGVPGYMLGLQRQYGNRYLQRMLVLARENESKGMDHQQPAQSDKGRNAGDTTRSLSTKVMRPLDEALHAFLAIVGPSDRGLAGAAHFAEQAPPGKANAEHKLKDTLQTALALEKELRASHEKYGEKDGFQGYGTNRAKDQYVCTTFAEEVLRRAGYKLTGTVSGQINIAINWEAELGKKTPNHKEIQGALAKLVEQGDPRTKGVVSALVSSKQGDEITIDQLRPGDFVQYWSSYSSGHVVQVSEVLSPGVIMAHGSHLSTRGVTTIKVNLKTKPKVYCVRPIGSSATVATGSAATMAAGPTKSAGTESLAWLNRAIKSNTMLGPKLGWLPWVDAIVTYFQKLGYLPPQQTPNEEVFVCAIRQYQSQNPPLTQDGILGPGTWRLLKADVGQNTPPAFSAKMASVTNKETADKNVQIVPLKGLRGLERSMAKIANEYGRFLKQQATELGIDVADAAGFLQVESGGRGSSAETGKMIIRFENHKFYDLWGKEHRDQFAQHFKFDTKKRWLGHGFRSDLKSDFDEVHVSQTREWQVFEFARQLDEEAALQSISMGLAQILGSNYKILGYSSASEMFDAMSGSLQTQAGGLFKFIANNRGGVIVKALKAKEYTLAARYYNGPGQEDLYGGKLKAASDAYARIMKRHAFPNS